MILIEKGVPMPSEANGRSKYPFATMEVGDSFFVTADDANGARQRAYNRARELNRKFTMRQVEGGVRFWRVK